MRRRNGPLFWATLGILTVIFVGPLLLIFLTSFKSQSESRTVPPTYFPQEPTLRAYDILFFQDDASPVL